METEIRASPELNSRLVALRCSGFHVLEIPQRAHQGLSRMAFLHNGVERDHQKSIVRRQPGKWRIIVLNIMMQIELCPCGFESATEWPIQAVSAEGRGMPGVWDARARNGPERASLVQRRASLPSSLTSPGCPDGDGSSGVSGRDSTSGRGGGAMLNGNYREERTFTAH